MRWVRHALVLALVPALARADVVFERREDRKMQLRVYADDLPDDRALLVTHTTRGAEVLTPGKLLQFKPRANTLQRIWLIDAKHVEPLRLRSSDEALAPILRDAIPCHEPFSAALDVPADSKAHAVRWTFEVKTGHDRCDARLTAKQYLDLLGGILPDAELTQPEPAPAALPAAPATSTAEGGMCSVGAGVPPSWGLVTLLGLLYARRRRD